MDSIGQHFYFPSPKLCRFPFFSPGRLPIYIIPSESLKSLCLVALRQVCPAWRGNRGDKAKNIVLGVCRPSGTQIII